jgi:hypothetical protein
MGEVLINRVDGQPFRKIINNATVELAKTVAAILSTDGIDKANAMVKAFGNFDESLVDDIAKGRYGSSYPSEGYKPVRESYLPHGAGPASYRLHSLVWEIRRRKPSQHPEDRYQEAWDSLTEAERSELRRAGAVPDDNPQQPNPEWRSAATNKQEDTKKMQNSFEAIAKSHGVMAIAKFVTEDDHAHSISEHEFVAAGNREFGKSKFTEMLCDMGDEGVTLRKALERLKQSAWVEHAKKSHPMPYAPMTKADADNEIAKMRKAFPGRVSQEPRVSHTLDVDNDDSEAVRNLKELLAASLRDSPWRTVQEIYAELETQRRAATRAAAGKRDTGSALAELNELAAVEKSRDPKLTKAQAFAQVYTDPENIELVKRERDENRPS